MRLVFVILLAVLAMTAHQAAGQDVSASGEAPGSQLTDHAGRRTVASRGIDVLHPQNFLVVYEVPTGRRCAAPSAHEQNDYAYWMFDHQVSMQVDKDGRICITLDRDWILQQVDFEAEIENRGEIQGPEGKRNIEIPGCSIVGETIQSSPARIRSSRELWLILHTLWDAWSELLAELPSNDDPDDEEYQELLLNTAAERTAARNALLDHAPLVEVLLKDLTPDDNRTLLQILVSRFDLTPQYVVQLAREISNTWLPVLRDDDQLAQQPRTTRNIWHFFTRIVTSAAYYIEPEAAETDRADHSKELEEARSWPMWLATC